jgi:hypothetical protein
MMVVFFVHFLAFLMLKKTYMKRNAEKISIEVGDEGPSLYVVKTPHQGNGATSLNLPSAHLHQTRPEVAVLGWDVRSYRLSLREHKA